MDSNTFAMETRIQVNGLRLTGFHGVAMQETRVGNIFSYDIEVAVPWEQAAMADDIGLSVSYADIVALVKRVNAKPSMLLENVAYRLQQELTHCYPQIKGGSVRVAKLTPPIAGSEMTSAAVLLRW